MNKSKLIIRRRTDQRGWARIQPSLSDHQVPTGGYGTPGKIRGNCLVPSMSRASTCQLSGSTVEPPPRQPETLTRCWWWCYTLWTSTTTEHKTRYSIIHTILVGTDIAIFCFKDVGLVEAIHGYRIWQSISRDFLQDMYPKDVLGPTGKQKETKAFTTVMAILGCLIIS